MGEARDLRLESNRLKTFEKWPLKFIKPEELAAAGFYFYPLPQSKELETDNIYFLLQRSTKNATIGDDRVRCFNCKLEVSGWKPGDDPFTDHEMTVPHCSFVRLVKRMCNK